MVIAMRSRPRVVMARLSTAKEHGSRDFDLEFWSRVSSEARAAAACELVSTTSRCQVATPLNSDFKDIVPARWGDLRVPVMSAAHLIANKKSVARPLEEAIARREAPTAEHEFEKVRVIRSYGERLRTQAEQCVRG